MNDHSRQSKDFSKSILSNIRLFFALAFLKSVAPPVLPKHNSRPYNLLENWTELDQGRLNLINGLKPNYNTNSKIFYFFTKLMYTLFDVYFPNLLNAKWLIVIFEVD